MKVQLWDQPPHSVQSFWHVADQIRPTSALARLSCVYVRRAEEIQYLLNTTFGRILKAMKVMLTAVGFNSENNEHLVQSVRVHLHDVRPPI